MVINMVTWVTTTTLQLNTLTQLVVTREPLSRQAMLGLKADKVLLVAVNVEADDSVGNPIFR